MRRVEISTAEKYRTLVWYRRTRRGVKIGAKMVLFPYVLIVARIFGRYWWVVIKLHFKGIKSFYVVGRVSAQQRQ